MEKPVQMSDFIRNGGVITVGKMYIIPTALLRNVWIAGRHIAIHKRLIWLN